MNPILLILLLSVFRKQNSFKFFVTFNEMSQKISLKDFVGSYVIRIAPLLDNGKNDYSYSCPVFIVEILASGSIHCKCTSKFSLSKEEMILDEIWDDGNWRQSFEDEPPLIKATKEEIMKAYLELVEEGLMDISPRSD